MREATRKQINRYGRRFSSFDNRDHSKKDTYSKQDRLRARDDIDSQLEEWEDEEYGFRPE